MSTPIVCDKCGAIVGVAGVIRRIDVKTFLTSLSKLPEKCNHRSLEITKKVKFFGFYREISVVVPGTEKPEMWVEYIGPPHKLLLILSIILSNYDSMMFKGKWVWWDPYRCLTGSGAEEFFKFQKNAVCEEINVR